MADRSDICANEAATEHQSGKLSYVKPLVLVIALLMQASVPVVFKISALSTPTHGSVLNMIGPLFFLGVALFGGRILLWHWLLRFYPLSILHPLQSLSLIALLLFGYILFDETITVNNIIGSIIIIVSLSLMPFAERQALNRKRLP